MMVAVAAIVFSLIPAERRWNHSQRLAAFHDQKRQEFKRLQGVAGPKRGTRRRSRRLHIAIEGPIGVPGSIRPGSPEWGDDELDLVHAFEWKADQHALLKRPFERAAWHPWEPTPAG
jgi:hypothetical protein